MRKKVLIIISFLILSFFSCRKNEDFSEITNLEYPTELYILTSVKGTIKSVRGTPVTGAQVQIGSEIKTSDFNGYFQFEQVSARKSGEIIKIEKEGFQTKYKTFYPQKDETIYVDIDLEAANGNIIFNHDDTNKKFTFKNLSASITENTFTKNDKPYSGEIVIKPLWADVSDYRFFENYPGDAIGYDKYFKTKGINSFGIIGVNISDNSDAKIELSGDNELELTIKTIESNPPAELSVWKFNFEKNKWLETKDKAFLTEKSGNKYYIASVKQTGIYNLATNFDVYEKEISINSVDGLKAQFMNVFIASEQINYQTNGRTSENGKILAYLPTDYKTNLKMVLDNIEYTNEIKKDENIIKIPEDKKMVKVIGKVINCATKPIENAYITIISNNDTIFYNADNNGIFSCNIFVAKNESKIKWIASDADNQINTFMHKASKKDIIDLDNVVVCPESFAVVQYGDDVYKMELISKDITSSTLALSFGIENLKLELGCFEFKGESNYDLINFIPTFSFNASTTKRLFPVGSYDIIVSEYINPGFIRGRLTGKARQNFDDQTTVKDFIINYSVKLE
jgi:hypothetical protein